MINNLHFSDGELEVNRYWGLERHLFYIHVCDLFYSMVFTVS